MLTCSQKQDVYSVADINNQHREKTTRFLFLGSSSHHRTWKAQGLGHLTTQLIKKLLETSWLSPVNLQGLGSSLVKWRFFKDRKEEQWWALGV